MSKPLSTLQIVQLRRLLERGLPLKTHPYQVLAEQIAASESQVLWQVQYWLRQGLFSRLGLIVKHRTLGYCANAMVVLDVPDDCVDTIGATLAVTPGVNLCYRRRRSLPDWPYNLFCMIHGRQQAQVRAQIETLLAANQLDHLPYSILFSTQAYKQRGGRYVASDDALYE